MWWSGFKPKLEQPHNEPEVINLSATDDVWQRAAKIWRLIGFVNDRFGAVPCMASLLADYQRIDENLRRALQANPRKRAKKHPRSKEG